MESYQSHHVIQGKVVTSDPPLLISNDMDPTGYDYALSDGVTSDPPLLISNDMDPSGYDYALSDGTDYAFSHTSDNISIKQEPETDTPEDNKFLNFAPPQFDELNMLVYEVLPRLKLPEDGRCVNPKISESCISPTSSLREGQSSQSTDKSDIELMSTSSGMTCVETLSNLQHRSPKPTQVVSPVSERQD
eukprot:580287_1